MIGAAGEAGRTSIGKRAALDLAPLIGGFVLLLGVATMLAWLFVASHSAAASATDTLRIRTLGYRLLSTVQDAETGQRGYLLSHDPAYLEPYLRAVADTPGEIGDLKTATAPRPAAGPVVDRLGALIQVKLDELASTIVPAEKGDFDGALAIVRNNSGNNAMTAIREQIASFEAMEASRQVAEAETVERNGIFLGIASLAGIATVLALGAYTIRDFGRRTRSMLAAQGDLQRTNENLEAIVGERVAELLLANEEIQRFAYIVSHDLRAPLVNVMGFTSELDAVRADIAGLLADVDRTAPHLVTPARRTAVEADLPEALGFIRSSTAKMDRLINAILKLSREGRRVLTPQPIDLRALVESQGQSLAKQLDAGDAELVVQADLPDIVSDRLAMEQIFGNLVENAAKYLQNGRPGLIEVTGERQGGTHRYLVKDNGRGIDAKDFERVFELFRRSGEQDKPGEGIGLAYVRNLARRLGGNVTVQSQFGEGSTFTVTLPATLKTKGKAFP